MPLGLKFLGMVAAAVVVCLGYLIAELARDSATAAEQAKAENP